MSFILQDVTQAGYNIRPYKFLLLTSCYISCLQTGVFVIYLAISIPALGKHPALLIVQLTDLQKNE